VIDPQTRRVHICDVVRQSGTRRVDEAGRAQTNRLSADAVMGRRLDSGFLECDLDETSDQNP
jgi:hypothetical protein